MSKTFFSRSAMWFCWILLTCALGTSSHAAIITVGQGVGYDYASIQTAIDNASAGDSISVAAGIYVEGSKPYRGNDSSTGLNFEFKNGITVTGVGPNTVIDLNGGFYGIMFDDSHNITMSNFAMYNGDTNAVTNFNAASNNLIENAIFGGTYDTIVEDYYDGVTLSNITYDTEFVPAIPEPSTFILFGLGLAAIGGFQWKRKQVG